MVLSPADLYGSLRVLKITLTIEFNGNVDQHYFLGSAWRGLIGWRLKELSCPFLEPPNCNLCAQKSACAYYLIMADRNPESHLGIYDLPRPYVLSPGPIESGRIQSLSITLFGAGTEVLPFILSAIIQGQSSPVGHEKGGYELIDVRPLISRPDYSPYTLAELFTNCDGNHNGGVLVRFLTPMRLKRKGMVLTSPDWPYLLENGLKRLEGIASTYESLDNIGKERWEEFKKVFLQAILPVSERYRWVPIERYSSKYGGKHPMAGFVGEALFSHIPRWQLMWLYVISLLGLGKGAAMGFGRLAVLNPFTAEKLHPLL